MDIRFHEKLYTDGLSEKKLALAKKKIKRKSPKINLFLITLPVGNQGILEIYWYPELLQSFYQKMDIKITVVGIARSRETAFELIKTVITDVGYDKGEIPIEQFFKECK